MAVEKGLLGQRPRPHTSDRLMDIRRRSPIQRYRSPNLRTDVLITSLHDTTKAPIKGAFVIWRMGEDSNLR